MSVSFLPVRDFPGQAMRAFHRWEADFRGEAGADPAFPHGISYVGSPPEDEAARALFRAAREAEALEAQVHFIRNCVISLMANGDYRENLDRIKGFLSCQHLDSWFAGDREEPLYSVMFYWTDPPCLAVRFNRFEEFDFVDAWDGQPAQRIFVRLGGRRRWSSGRIGAFVEGLVDDFDFDGFALQDLSAERGRGGPAWKAGLWVQYEVCEEDPEEEEG